MDTSEEYAVAQLACDILKGASIGLDVIVLQGDDEAIELPAVVVNAEYQEIEWALKKNGVYGGRYRLEVELRGIRTKPGTVVLEKILGAIADAFNEMPDPVPESAAAFSYYLIEKWEGADKEPGEETRSFKRNYTVFALLT